MLETLDILIILGIGILVVVFTYALLKNSCVQTTEHLQIDGDSISYDADEQKTADIRVKQFLEIQKAIAEKCLGKKLIIPPNVRSLMTALTKEDSDTVIDCTLQQDIENCLDRKAPPGGFKLSDEE